MSQNTNLNISPYYDDFNKADNFSRVLFRPGFAVQARELTTLQSILQDQIESHGKHLFKEGTVVIPGQASYSRAYTTLRLDTTFGGEDVVLEQFLNEQTPVIITGSTTGVKAKVIGWANVTTTRTNPTLYVQYIAAGNDFIKNTFGNGENITADITITHTTSYTSGIACGTTVATQASNYGSGVTVQSGIYFVRGQFVRCNTETLILNSYSNFESARVGFNITETLVTPETDTTLTDNATGSNNYAAKGAHRLKISLRLAKRTLTDTNDTNFIELIRIKKGQIVSQSRSTEYSVIGDMIARRTFDESGDYTVRPYQFQIHESIDNDYKGTTNKGIYGNGKITNQNSNASESLLALQISPGKAYVKGYEIENISNTFLDVIKARDFNTVNAGISTFELGNFVNITNAYQIPDIGAVTGELTAYKTIGLFDETTVTRGSSSGTQVGLARARSIEHSSGTQGDTTAVSKLFLFDIRPFTYITLNATPSVTLVATHANGGVQIKGATSGATGFVHGPLTSGTQIVLTTVIGNFVTGERLIASDSALTGKLSEVRVLAAAAHNDSVATITVDSTVGFSETGTITIGSEQITYTGRTATTFTGATRGANSTTAAAHLDNAAVTQEVIISSPKEVSIVTKRFSDVRSLFIENTTSSLNFTADAVLEFQGAPGRVVTENILQNDNVLAEFDASEIGLESNKIAKLKQPEKNVSLFKLPKNTIKTLLTTVNSGTSDTQFTVRRSFVGTTNSSGVVTFSAGSNETFVSFATKDYTISVLTAGDGSAAVGDLILLNSTKVTTTGTATLTVTDATLLGDGAKVKLHATLLRTSIVSKAKTTNLSKKLNVASSDDDGAYGTRSTDKEISLGRGDVYRLQAVFDSESDSVTDALAPQFTISNIVGTFLKGEKITGGSSKALGRIITTSSPISYVLNAGFGATNFNTAETITGASSGATATVGTLTAGSKVITSSFTLDTGQRDNFYDIARIVRKPNASTPTGRLLVVYDYFSHGTGDAFTVDSYSASAGQMEYDDIQTYTATKVDPDEPEPTGQFDLKNCFDFRPKVEDVAGANVNVDDDDTITGNSFDFFSRQYDGIGASTVDFPKPASNLQADFEYFLSKFAALYLTPEGRFKLVHGISAEIPSLPKPVTNALKLATLFLPAYTFSPKDVTIKRYSNQRYTMKDIGKLKDRLEVVESLTALTLLEKSAESFEIQDQNGLNRFKSGFVVDNFSSHKVGDALNKDYKIAVDQGKHILRPMIDTNQVALIENVTTDLARTGAGYQKTGDLLTLPYTTEAIITQPYATRIENVQPYLLSNWKGIITLNPPRDDWFEGDFPPEIISNENGDYDTLLTKHYEGHVTGTLYNDYGYSWLGETEENEVVPNIKSGEAIDRTLVFQALDNADKEFPITTAFTTDDGDTIKCQITNIPYVRSKKIEFTGSGFQPNTKIYAFFNNKDVNAFITPDMNLTAQQAGDDLITGPSGNVKGSFTIPEFKQIGQENNPQFQTGELEFTLTSSSINAIAGIGGVINNPATHGKAIYRAFGLKYEHESDVISTADPIINDDASPIVNSVIIDGSIITEAEGDTLNSWFADGRDEYGNSVYYDTRTNTVINGVVTSNSSLGTDNADSVPVVTSTVIVNSEQDGGHITPTQVQIDYSSLYESGSDEGESYDDQSPNEPDDNWSPE